MPKESLHELLECAEAGRLHTLPARKIETVLLKIVAERTARRLFQTTSDDIDLLHELTELCATDLVSLLYVEMKRRIKETPNNVDGDIKTAIRLMDQSNWIHKEIKMAREVMETLKDGIKHSEKHLEALEERHAGVKL